MKYNLPAWPSNVKKNDNFVYVGMGKSGGITSLTTARSIMVSKYATTIDSYLAATGWSGTSCDMHYFVQKDDPFLKQFEINHKPNMPAHLPPLPEGYVYLGRSDEINVPQEWHELCGWKKELIDFAWFWSQHGATKWKQASKGWVIPQNKVYLAAKPNSELYLLNKTAPKEKLQSLQAEIEKLKAKM